MESNDAPFGGIPGNPPSTPPHETPTSAADGGSSVAPRVTPPEWKSPETPAESAAPAAPAASTDDSSQADTPTAPAGNASDSAVDTESYPEPRRRPLPRVIAIANQKGGVGKTTTTVNLGAALAEQGHRTLLIDLDPQGNASTGLGINAREVETSIYEVLLMKLPMEDATIAAGFENLLLVPSNLNLAGAEIELVNAMSRETQLRRAIAEVKDDYDYVLIDCPPSLGLLTINALAAADEVLVPIQCEYYALEGLTQLIRNVDLVQRNLNTSLELSTLVLVMYDNRTNLASQVEAEVREHFRERVCKNTIPRNIRLSEAPSHGQPITAYAPSSRGSVAYRELAREVHSVSS